MTMMPSSASHGLSSSVDQTSSTTVVIVVGAGPSGLSTAACLSRLSIPYILLEREDCFGSLWKKKSYDRLHLHLAKQFCELPHFSLPTNLPRYVSRNDYVRYIDDYVDYFGISPLYNRRVKLARYDESEGKWHVKVNVKKLLDEEKPTKEEEEEEELYVGRFLVVATGETCDPFVPAVEGLNGFPGKVMHSTQYKSGKELCNNNYSYGSKEEMNNNNNRVLVVGCGNSGMEIALDLANHGVATTIVVRSQVHILSRGMVYAGLKLLKYFPLKVVDSIMVILSRLVYGDLTKVGMNRPQEGPFLMKVKYGKYPVIDVGAFSKIKAGHIQVMPGVGSIKGNDVIFQNGESHPFNVIIFATGFTRSTHTWLQGDDYLLDKNGIPKPSFPDHWKGKNGLYCAGLARRGLYGAALDAQNIADHINSLLLS